MSTGDAHNRRHSYTPHTHTHTPHTRHTHNIIATQPHAAPQTISKNARGSSQEVQFARDGNVAHKISDDHDSAGENSHNQRVLASVVFADMPPHNLEALLYLSVVQKHVPGATGHVAHHMSRQPTKKHGPKTRRQGRAQGRARQVASTWTRVRTQ